METSTNDQPLDLSIRKGKPSDKAHILQLIINKVNANTLKKRKEIEDNFNAQAPEFKSNKRMKVDSSKSEEQRIPSTHPKIEHTTNPLANNSLNLSIVSTPKKANTRKENLSKLSLTELEKMRDNLKKKINKNKFKTNSAVDLSKHPKWKHFILESDEEWTPSDEDSDETDTDSNPDKNFAEDELHTDLSDSESDISDILDFDADEEVDDEEESESDEYEDDRETANSGEEFSCDDSYEDDESIDCNAYDSMDFTSDDDEDSNGSTTSTETVRIIPFEEY